MILSQILCFERWFAGQLKPHGSMDLCFHAWTHPLRPGGLFRWCLDDNCDATVWHICATVCHCATEEMEAYRLYTVVPRLVSKTQVMWATRKSTNLILVTLILNDLKLPGFLQTLMLVCEEFSGWSDELVGATVFQWLCTGFDSIMCALRHQPMSIQSGLQSLCFKGSKVGPRSHISRVMSYDNDKILHIYINTYHIIDVTFDVTMLDHVWIVLWK